MAAGGGLLDPGEAMERLDAWKGNIDRLAADTKAMSDQLRDLRLTVGDRDGIVEVTVDSVGALVDLRLSARIQRLPPDQVASIIMDTLLVAKARLADQAQEIIAATVGTSSPAARAISARVGQQLRGDEDPDGR
jgi:DNA-binding protein YbaB